jgi:hypothetical protein
MNDKLVRFFANLLDRVSRGAVRSHFMAGATAFDNDPRADEYRRLTGAKRDLPPLAFDRAMLLSFEMWKRNPIAKKLIEIFVDFCLGDEFAVKVKIKKRTNAGQDIDTKRLDAQKLWEDFEADPVNNLREDMPQFIQDLFLNGELVLPVKVNLVENADGTYTGDGSVRIGYIDPLNVKEVVPAAGNVRLIEIVKVQGLSSTQLTPLKVVNIDLDPNSRTYQKRVGEVFYFRINRVVNQTRGHGIIVDLLDWLDAFDQFLFDSLEGVRLRNSFFYDLELKGLNEEQLKAKAQEITPPRNGSIRIHNENARYQVHSPDLKTQDIEKGMLTFMTFIVGSKGFPLMWFGHGGDTNKATASEMAKPTLRMLQRMQTNVRKIVKTLAYFVTDQAVLAGQLKLAEDEYIDCEVSMVDLTQQDESEVTVAFRELVTGLTYAVDKGWVSEETAKKLVDGWMLRKFGVEVDPNETIDGNLDELAKGDAEAIYSQTPPANIVAN